MELVGEAVPHGNAGILRQLFHNALAKAAVLDAVKHSAQNPGGVLHTFLDANLAAGGAQVSHVGTLVVRGHLKRAARAGRSLFKNKGYILAFEGLLLAAGLFVGL